MEPLSTPTVILCAGKISATTLPVNTGQSVGMLPVNGKPVIGWILDDLLRKKIFDAVIVSRTEDQQLRDFVNWAYSQRMKIQFAFPTGETILHSLQAGLLLCEPGRGVRIILGDTLIRDDFDTEDNFVYTGIVEDGRRWCLVNTSPVDNIVQGYTEKPDSLSSSQTALAGYYHLADMEHLQLLLDDCLRQDAHELSDVLRRFGQKHPIYAILAHEWYDFGHIDNLVDARRRLLQPRFFNSLMVNPVLNTITKTSQNNEKLQNELDWYLSLPGALQVLTPRILSHQNIDDQVRIVQEYYGYPTLAELYVFGDLDIELWEAILRKVMRIHREFRQYDGKITQNEVKEMYLGKTKKRLDLLARDSYWETILARPFIEYNGQILKNLHILFPSLTRQIQYMSTSVSCHIIHGDLCFSNILFDINHQIVRLIDPRGHFGSKGIFGDPRYDVAKLRHSISGLYDFILADLYKVEETTLGIFFGRIFANKIQTRLSEYFDTLLAENGYMLKEIRLLEGLLFVSMLPYHQDNPGRQKMFYLTGLALLNEVLE